MTEYNQQKEGNGGISRRTLLLTMAGMGAARGFLPGKSYAAQPQLPSGSQSDWPSVRVAYVRPKEKYWLGWPGTSWDPEGFVVRAKGILENFGKELKVRLAFEPEPLYDTAAVEQFIGKAMAEKPDGLLIIPLHMDRWKMVESMASKSETPTVIFAPLGVCFTGHIQKVSKLPRVYLASSPDFDLKPARFGLKMIRTAHDIRRSKILVLTGKETKEATLDPLGLKLRYLPRQRFVEALNTVKETAEVRAIAEEYRKAARKVVEPTPVDLINASKNYLASLQIMKEEGCQGISMDCLGLVRDRQIPCPPCLAWSKLLDAGIPGVCEADINAVMSHTLTCLLLDKPGFMQDPVPETVNNTFIGAHCVSPTRLDGYQKPRAPFILRSHAESNLGVSVQVLWEPGRDVTIMQFVGAGKMILGSGKVLRNFDTPPAGGCRTSVELRIDGPEDTRDTKGFHQLFIYGSHVRDFQAYGQMYGIATEHI